MAKKDKSLVRDLWQCGDNMFIEYAMVRARLNVKEREVLYLMLDECMTQEQVAEYKDVSTRTVQEIWHSATTKILNIPWAYAYAVQLRESQ